MKVKEKIKKLLEACDQKIHSQFGFYTREASFSKFVDYMFIPKDSSSLALTRILFGLAMLFDIPDERGGFNMEKRWGDSFTCHFPLIPYITPLPMPYMGIIYAGLWFGALGIMLGYKYRVSAIVFTSCYWYLFIIEKSYWNNHSYLFGLVAFLLTFTDAGFYWSIDTYLNPSKLKTEVPYWNYFVLKYQFFILYFMAGMKKGTAEWLTGYSVQNLSEHWVFEPFKLFLTVPQTDYLIVHWFVFAFDLTVAIWMMWSSTRNVAMVFCALFHLMNSRLFSIGMFPWVCLATMPLFYPFDWPKQVLKYIQDLHSKIAIKLHTFQSKENDCECKNFEKSDTDIIERDGVIENLKNKDGSLIEQNNGNTLVKDNPNKSENRATDKTSKSVKRPKENKNKRITVIFILFYVLIQAFLPYSHFITKGYNNWTNGLYGYSWDMMVHTWDTQEILVKVIDNHNNTVYFVDPLAYTPNDRWTRHGDMAYQYARCLKNNIEKQLNINNMSIYIDVWCSMNGRFTQRLFDPKVDLLNVEWSPFERVKFLMPLLDEALSWRNVLDEIRDDVHKWSNTSDVLFLADFPGYEQEKYVPFELKNVTLTVMEGSVVYEPQVTNLFNGHSYKLATGDAITVDIGIFHKVKTIGKSPAYYMYTYSNNTETQTEYKDTPKLPIFTELFKRFYKMATFCKMLFKCVAQILFNFCDCNK